MKKTIQKAKKTELLLWMILLLGAAVLLAGPVQAAKKKKVTVISSITVRNSGGDVVDQFTYSYNSHGLVSKKTYTTYDFSMTNKYQYNKNLQIKKETIVSGGHTTDVHTYKYNKKHQLKSSTLNMITMDEVTTFSYRWNSAGRLTGWTEEQQNGAESDTTITYDKSGRIQSFHDQPFDKKTYSYDKNGVIIKQKWGKSLFRKYTNTYSGKRLKTQTAYYPNGRKICTTTITYKTIQVPAADVKAVNAQQVFATQDPVFGMFSF